MKYAAFAPVNFLMGISFLAVGLLIFVNLRGKGRSPSQ
jgi:hypothetical protein